MVIFNAIPAGLKDLFDDPRKDAKYCDLASFKKMQAYTVGFNRSAYGRPCVLRKIGGNVPDEWGEVNYPTLQWHEMDRITTMQSAAEPIKETEKGQFHHFLLVKNDNRITFTVNGVLVHDYEDNLEYPYCDRVLKNGHIAFRNFGGPAVDVYKNFIIREQPKEPTS